MSAIDEDIWPSPSLVVSSSSGREYSGLDLRSPRKLRERRETRKRSFLSRELE